MSDKPNVVASYSAASVTTIMGLSINEWVAVAGIALGLATFITNVYFKYAMLKIQRNASNTKVTKKTHDESSTR